MQCVYVFEHEVVSVRGNEHGRFNRLVSNKELFPILSCLKLGFTRMPPAPSQQCSIAKQIDRRIDVLELVGVH